MTSILPPGVDEQAFDAAMNAFSVVVGDDGLLQSASALKEYSDPYAFVADDTFMPSAVLLPTCVDQVRAIVGIANQHRVPLWVVSQGRNLGYGGGAPRVRGSVVVSLRRMNRVLEVNEECAYAVVEPGVTFIDLYEHLKAGGHKLVASVPDLGSGSVVGNALEYGRGYTPHGDHAASHCGMEVVLPDGNVFRTGMGGVSRGNSWHVYQRGFGPSLDGLFMQSNFGIVTKMGVWLMPTPEWYLSGSISVKREADLEPLIDIVRKLLLNRVIENYPVLANPLSIASSFSTRDRWYQGDGPVPESVIDDICQEIDVGRWNMRFALYGSEAVVDAQFATVTAALSSIPDARIEGRKYKGDAPPDQIPPMDRSQIGIPSLDMLAAVKWRGEAGGHMGFSPVSPLVGRDVLRQYELLRPIMNEHGFDYMGGILVLPRCTLHVFEFVYDAADEGQVRRARQGCKALLQAAAAAGYGEYRSHLEHMDDVAGLYDFNDYAAMRLNTLIKDALDPNGILSPGKQGIWPRSMREDVLTASYRQSAGHELHRHARLDGSTQDFSIEQVEHDR